MNKGILIIISGFSGAGKGTIVKRLIKDYENYALSISMTTRKPRQGEQDGIEYFFVDKEMFEQKITKGNLLEYASYCDHYYGTPKEYVESQLDAGKDVILEIEIQGALKIKELMPDCLLLFVTPPSANELRNRLVGRGTETQEVIDKRLKRAVEESEGIEAYDFIIVNDNLEECIKDVHAVISNAHNTPYRKMEFIEKIRKELRDSKGAI